MTGPLGFHPWRSIWFHPKKTIRSVVDFQPSYKILWLSFIYGFYSLVGISQTLLLGNTMAFLTLFILITFFAMPFGFIILSFFGWILHFTGKCLKGSGSFLEIRASIAWAHVPLLVSNFMFLILFVFFQESFFQETVRYRAYGAEILLGSSFLFLLMTAWSLVLYVGTLSEVQRFSISKTLLNLFLATLVFFGIILGCFFIARGVFVLIH